MRYYECHFGYGDKDVCKYMCWNYIRNVPAGTSILITDYTQKETSDYINTLINLINKIQPCELVEKDGVTYISYKLIGLYNNDLILLNFIRNLWHEHKVGYAKAFFERLDEVKNMKKFTPFEKLCEANVYAVKECGMKGYGNHANCHEKVKVKKLPKDFLTKQICETRDFLCD